MTSETATQPAAPARASTQGRLRDAQGAFEFDPHHCFACGELNEHGLRLELHADPDGAWTDVVLSSRFQGWESVAHGGIACTILDEVMAWSVIGRGTWGVTARLNVAFRRPIPTGIRIRAEGWVNDLGRRAARTGGRIIDASTGEVLATGEATFIAVPNDQLAKLMQRYGMRRLPDIGRIARPGTTGRGAAGSQPDRAEQRPQ